MNFFRKTILKLKDPVAYKQYTFEKNLQRVQHPSLAALDRTAVHFKHSGNIGDIIYALPCMLAIAGDADIHLHLNVHQKALYGKMHHPLGNVMLNEKMVELLQPLLLSQPKIKTCDVFTGQPIDVDLDIIREYPLLLDRGNIARWYFWAYGVNYDLCKPWLSVTPDRSVQNAIIVARSHRYHAPGIDYCFLSRQPEVYFIGLPSEFELMKKMVPRITHLPTDNFLELARLIAGCRLFIGNQSFPFSVAEALKVKRLLEVYFRTPNVTVYGENGYDFCFQPQFEKLATQLYEG